LLLAEDETEDDELLAAGRAWIHDSEPGAEAIFRALAEEMMASGQSEEVLEACRQLLDETTDSNLIDALNYLSLIAQKQSPSEYHESHKTLG